ALFVLPAPGNYDGERWHRMADMLTPHEYHTSLAVHGKIYSVGGTEQAEFEEFDVAENRSKLLPKMPTSRVFLGAAALGDQIYAIGGLSRDREFQATVEVYSIVDGSW